MDGNRSLAAEKAKKGGNPHLFLERLNEVSLVTEMYFLINIVFMGSCFVAGGGGKYL